MGNISPIPAAFVIILLTTLITITTSAPPTPTTWKEHWFEHNQDLTRVYLNNNLALYFDKDVDRSITWPRTYLSRVWEYVKKRYGNFGGESQLYAIFHTGKYSGGHPSTYFDSSHDDRNVIDVGSNSADAWKSGKGFDLDITTHEVAHIVELASKGIHGSPAFPRWGDSKWAEVFNYDVYLNLGMDDEAKRIYNIMINNKDNFPRENTYWFRDWFYPIYSQYGKGAALNNFFTLLSQNFRKNGNSNYNGEMNMGEFVHFWSGASGKNLKDMATKAFGWTSEYQTQFERARQEFRNVKYA